MILPTLGSPEHNIDTGVVLPVSQPLPPGAAQTSVDDKSAADAILGAEIGDESLPELDVKSIGDMKDPHAIYRLEGRRYQCKYNGRIFLLPDNPKTHYPSEVMEVSETVSLNAFLRDPAKGSTISVKTLLTAYGSGDGFARILASELNSSNKALVASDRGGYTVFFRSEDGESIRKVRVARDDMFGITGLSEIIGDPSTSHLRKVVSYEILFLRLLRDQCGIEFPCPMGPIFSPEIENVARKFEKKV